jgi:hypothetical protein
MSYRTWKYKTAPAPEPTLDLKSSNDFPSLGSVKPVVVTQGISLAEKLKKTIQAEEELSSMARFQKSRVSPKLAELQALPMPNFIATLQRKRQEKEEQKNAEIQEEEENYRWQINRSMYHSEQEAEPYESNSSQTQEDDHYSNQERNEEHDHT